MRLIAREGARGRHIKRVRLRGCARLLWVHDIRDARSSEEAGDNDDDGTALAPTQVFRRN